MCSPHVESSAQPFRSQGAHPVIAYGTLHQCGATATDRRPIQQGEPVSRVGSESAVDPIRTSRIEAHAAAAAPPPGMAAPRPGCPTSAARASSLEPMSRKAKNAEPRPQPASPLAGSRKKTSSPAAAGLRA